MPSPNAAACARAEQRVMLEARSLGTNHCPGRDGGRHYWTEGRCIHCGAQRCGAALHVPQTQCTYPVPCPYHRRRDGA
jgi:hypothetical protein